MNAILVERDYKGIYERFALTHEEFAAEFPEVFENNPGPITESDTCTIRPLVHIWYCPVTVGDDKWETFFTDMEDGLPESDIKSGNVAYIREDFLQSLKEEVRPYLERQNKYFNAIEYFSGKEGTNLKSSYAESDKDHLIYCYEHEINLIDFDYWSHYEDLVGEKLTFEEYLAIDKEFDGEPLDVEMDDTEQIGKFKELLAQYRRKCD